MALRDKGTINIGLHEDNVEMSNKIVNIYEHTRYRRNRRSKRVWNNKKDSMNAKRIGPDVDGGVMEYYVKWRGGWGIVKPHELRPLIQVLQTLYMDACDRVYFKDEEKKA